MSGTLDVNFTTQDGRQILSLKAEVGEPKALGDAPPATTFHRFTELPPEIRVLIWKLCLQNPRIFRLGPDSDDFEGDLERRWVPFVFSHKPLACAQVCHEARALFKAETKQLFGLNSGMYKSLRFSPSTDILYWDQWMIDYDTLRNFAPDYQDIHNLAVDWPGEVDIGLFILLKEASELLPDFKKLFVVMPHQYLHKGDVKFSYVQDNDEMNICFNDEFMDWDELRCIIEIWLPDDHKIDVRSIEGVEVNLVRD
ncbi:hypothetical protein ACHAPU_006678 [Fusarium lateritium]